MKITNLILKPVITEKSTQLQSTDKYSFRVNLGASKSAIAQAVADQYKVDVLAVRTIIVPKRTRRITGTRRFSVETKWKKAIVTVKKDQTINLFEIGKEGKDK